MFTVLDLIIWVAVRMDLTFPLNPPNFQYKCYTKPLLTGLLRQLLQSSIFGFSGQAVSGPSSGITKDSIVESVYLSSVRQSQPFHRWLAEFQFPFFTMLQVLTVLEVFSSQPPTFQDSYPGCLTWVVLSSVVKLIPNYPQFVIVVPDGIDDLTNNSRRLRLRLDFSQCMFYRHRDRSHDPEFIAQNLTLFCGYFRHNVSTNSLYLSKLYRFALAIVLSITIETFHISIW